MSSHLSAGWPDESPWALIDPCVAVSRYGAPVILTIRNSAPSPGGRTAGYPAATCFQQTLTWLLNTTAATSRWSVPQDQFVTVAARRSGA